MIPLNVDVDSGSARRETYICRRVFGQNDYNKTYTVSGIGLSQACVVGWLVVGLGCEIWPMSFSELDGTE